MKSRRASGHLKHEAANSASEADSAFPLLFAEATPAEYLEHAQSFDITSLLSEWLGPIGKSGRRDKILILTSQDPPDAHADFVAVELVRRGETVCRFNTDTFLQSFELSISLESSKQASSTLASSQFSIPLEEVKSVWFRRPLIPEPGLTRDPGSLAHRDEYDFVRREAEAALHGVFAVLSDSFWVTHPDTLKAADNKISMLRVARQLGLQIPRTLVTNDPKRARDFFHACDRRMIVKTFRGYSGSISGELKAIWTSPVLEEHLERIELVRNVPCLFQEYVPKDVELRVTVIGRRVFACEIHSQRSAISRDDWRRYDLDNTPYVACSLPDAVELACLKLLDAFSLPFGAIDLIRRPDGTYVFLEVNANGQWLWIEELTELPLVAAMADLLQKGTLR